ncbi:MAG: hypothetical protein JWQ45_2525 [Blastococcus sp.]|jgi:hypothetical protein|nr:hypothetical protein [Blastococcus sp.]
MRIGGPAWLGLVVALGVTVGCTASPEAPPPPTGTAAVPAYRAPAGAPGFCTRLAGSTHVPAIPLAIGTLTADPGNTDAVGALEDAVADLEAVLDDLSDGDRYGDVTAGLEDLLAALHSATVNPVDDALRVRIHDRLAAVGTQVQPVCDFPT